MIEVQTTQGHRIRAYMTDTLIAAINGAIVDRLCHSGTFTRPAARRQFAIPNHVRLTVAHCVCLALLWIAITIAAIDGGTPRRARALPFARFLDDGRAIRLIATNAARSRSFDVCSVIFILIHSYLFLMLGVALAGRSLVAFAARLTPLPLPRGTIGGKWQIARTSGASLCGRIVHVNLQSRLAAPGVFQHRSAFCLS